MIGRQNPSPALRGRGGAQAEGLGGEGLYRRLSKTLTSQRYALGPSSPVKTGEGRKQSGERLFESRVHPYRGLDGG